MKRGEKYMRTAEINRKTKETDISVQINLDGSGKSEIATGIGFFDHMLTSLAKHAGFDIKLTASGDLDVDCHHTIEDTGICLGKAFAKALDSKDAILRYGSFYVPMDEALAFCCVDISGRPHLVFNAAFQDQKIGEYDTQMTVEFFRAFAFNAFITLHLNVLYGENDHHITEALFKAFAHALSVAAAKGSQEGILSTKGTLS